MLEVRTKEDQRSRRAGAKDKDDMFRGKNQARQFPHEVFGHAAYLLQTSAYKIGGVLGGPTFKNQQLKLMTRGSTIEPPQ